MRVRFHAIRFIVLAGLLSLPAVANGGAQTVGGDQTYQYEETRDLVALVNEASALVRDKGEAAFADFRSAGGHWRQGEMYIFVLDPEGNMLVHPDPALEGKNQIGLLDVNGKPIIRGLLAAATTSVAKPEGWYHYQWPVPGGFLPRWKSTFVRLVAAPSGKRYVVGSGIYNDRMERAFVVDAVTDAVAHIQKDGTAAFPLFRDPKGRFIAKDAYVFVIDPAGIDLVNPAFPNLEGRNLLDVKDTQGKLLIREMLNAVETKGSGWVDYMWPKPGESVSTLKSAYVTKATIGDKWVMVGCGVYLADAPKASRATTKMTAPALMALVREAATLLERRGADAYPEFMQRGSKWFHDDTYFVVYAMDGTRVMHAANPELEGRNVADAKDVLGRPYGRMFLATAGSAAGEGWVHYMYPEPADIFPTWKSTFVKRVTFPSGKQHLVGCGIYNMDMDETFIEDVVNRASELVAAQGKDAFAQLRDKTGSFVFLDTYVFVDTPDGAEVVNPGQPSMEGMNMRGLTDVNGKPVADAYIAAALKDGTAWVDYYWYRPGENTPAPKRTYVRKVQSGTDVYIVGSGFYSK